MSSRPTVVEHFFGVYLLYCKNPQHLGKTYIGYTVDPNRRIKQHNKGRLAGGARKTSNKGPWEMVMIIHGFPNDISALRFEWAWQNPLKSRRLAILPGIKKTRTENLYQFNIRVLSEMLWTGPWCRLPLTIQWLADEYIMEFPANKSPPMHMPICYGAVVSKKLSSTSSLSGSEQKVASENENAPCVCDLCEKTVLDEVSQLTCVNTGCDLTAHISCVATRFIEIGEYVPIQGICPKCLTQLLWGDLIKKSRGCYKNLSEENMSYSSESDFDIDILSYGVFGKICE